MGRAKGAESQTWSLGQLKYWAHVWAPLDFEAFTKKKSLQGKMLSFFPDFEVLSKKESLQGKMALFFTNSEVIFKRNKIKVFTIQRADFTCKKLITVFGLFQISLIIFICTVLRPSKEDLFVCRKPYVMIISARCLIISARCSLFSVILIGRLKSMGLGVIVTPAPPHGGSSWSTKINGTFARKKLICRSCTATNYTQF